MEGRSDSYNWLFKWLGYATGRLYNIHKDWENEPQWLRDSYRLEMEIFGGDFDTPISGAIKGMVEGTKTYAKKHKYDAAKMGVEFANAAGVSPQNGIVFATEYLKTIIRE